jgi:predicted DNA-binding antitoxin AbrB/MazE fold protein
MEAVRAYYDGRVFTPEEPVKLAKNRTVIISFSEDDTAIVENPYRITAEEKLKRDAAELEYLNTNAERMNAEMADVLRYQKDIF